MSGFLKAVKKFFIGLLLVAVLLAAGFGAGYMYCNIQIQKEPEAEVIQETEDETEFDLELPGEVEKRVVTVDEVESKLSEVAELTSYASDYKIEKAVDSSRYLLDDHKVLGTTNSIDITCQGIVKISYDISDIKIRVSDDTIFVGLPEGYVSDNYVIWDTVECEESNNFLNPIDFSQYKALIAEIEEEGLKDAEDKGIYEAADKNLEKIITNTLSAFEDYQVEFM